MEHIECETGGHDVIIPLLQLRHLLLEKFFHGNAGVLNLPIEREGETRRFGIAFFDFLYGGKPELGQHHLQNGRDGEFLVG